MIPRVKEEHEKYTLGLHLYDDTLIGQFYFEYNSKYWGGGLDFEPRYTSSYLYTIPKETNIKTILTEYIFQFYD